jgi:hypothetical protein
MKILDWSVTLRHTVNCHVYVAYFYFIILFNDALSIILWHVDPLLGNDREISNYTTAVTKQRTVNSYIGTVFSVRSVVTYYKQGQLAAESVSQLAS